MHRFGSIFLITIVSLTHGSSSAMGEIERGLNWFANLHSAGAHLAEIENQKQRIRARYEIKRAELRNQITRETREHLIVNLNRQKQLSETQITDFTRIAEQERALLKSFEEQRRDLREVANQHYGQTIELQLLIESVRQEIQLSDGQTQTFEELLAICEAFHSRTKTVTPTCALLSLLKPEDEGAPTRLALDRRQVQQGLVRLGTLVSETRRSLLSAEEEISVQRALILAINKRLEGMGVQ